MTETISQFDRNVGISVRSHAEMKKSVQHLRQNSYAGRGGISFCDRLRSGYHRIWYEATQALAWSRGTVSEPACGHLPDLTPFQQTRISELAAKYGNVFEVSFLEETALSNYAYLDLLDRARLTLNWSISDNLRVCDVGSGNFAYAAALHAFFRPAKLVGVEVDGHRLYYNGRSRIDYARGYIQNLPHTTYMAVDYRQYSEKSDIITAWYPFVTPKPLLAWRLPLSLFDPGAFFAQVANNLVMGGVFLMVNHSPAEGEVAKEIAQQVGLVCTGQYIHRLPLRPRTAFPVVTIWHHG